MATMTATVEAPATELQPIPLEQGFSPAEEMNVSRAKEKWNEPRINQFRLGAAFVSFAVVGANDGAYGALLPYIREEYNLSTTAVSAIFITPFVGYTIAAIAVNHMHMKLGQRGIALIGPICQLIPYAVISAKPPFPVILVFYSFVGLGNGLIDAAWSAWVGDMVNANSIMGVLHGFYGIGATVAPAIATAMISHGLSWRAFYFTMIGGTVLELASGVPLFWSETAEQFRIKNPKTTDSGGKSRFVSAVRNRVTITLAVFLFVYMGVEVAVGGWIVEFMMQVRHGAPFESGLIPTGFWLGITVGRLSLGFLTEWMGERIALSLYMAIAIGLELVFWLVPQFIVSAIAVSFLGFFIGPLWPGAMVVAAKLLPKHLHTAAIGIACALGGGGGAVLPFIAGAIASSKGVAILQPFGLAVLVAMIVLWLTLPRTPKHAHAS